jgi:hypothetical protein
MSFTDHGGSDEGSLIGSMFVFQQERESPLG